MNRRSMIKKLQMALRYEGFIITVSSGQFYLQSGKRYITIYHIRHGKKELFKSASQINVIKYLAALYDIIKAKPKSKKDSLTKKEFDKLKEITDGNKKSIKNKQK